MKDKRLILHIGSFKTGTTAIQGFLKSNHSALAGAGLNYVQAGRSNIAHNAMVPAFRKNRGARICREIAAEIKASPAQVHVISSEMFFRVGIAEALGTHLSQELKSRTTVVAYVRRQDQYLEALYKQLVKNGRIAPGAMQFHDERLDTLAYSGVLGAYGDQFGVENMIVRPFERKNFASGDVVQDFLGHTGVSLPGALKQPGQDTNKTLSAPVSEMLGMLGRNAGVNTRALIRVLIRQNSQGAARSGDVYDLATRRAIVAAHAADNETVRETYCPDLETLFDTSDLDRKDDPCPSPVEQVENWRMAAQAVAKGLGGLQE